MWNNKISISVQSENKNNFIRNCKTEWIGFVDEEVATEQEMRQLLEENAFLEEYDVLLFGDNVPEGECSLAELLASLESVIYALFFRKALLVYTGSFNEMLPDNDVYELALRLSERGKVYSIPCSAEKEEHFDALTMAYIIRRYMKILKEYNLLDELVVHMFERAERFGKSAEFGKAMNLLISKEGEYERIASDTAPCLVMVAEDELYGVVTDFGGLLADALVSLGQAVITTDGSYGDYHNISTDVLLQQVYKAIIGFQSPAFGNEIFRKMKGNKYQIWFDNPVFSIELFAKLTEEKRIRVLCHDRDYAEYIRKHYLIEKVTQFPLASGVGEMPRGEECYDLVFIGNYTPYKEPSYGDDFQREFYQYMITHPKSTVEQGIRAVWQEKGMAYDEQRFMEASAYLWHVCSDVMKHYRYRVLETILGAGIQMHVFGDTWKDYHGPGSENLIFHPVVFGEEAWEIWAKAKIGLNIMNGHKHGMTERIANIMMCGACCLSDSTSYLEDNFRDGEEIVLFDAEALEELPGIIQYLLAHDDERRSIALAGQKKARREHTWRKRAEQLLDIINADVSEGNVE